MPLSPERKAQFAKFRHNRRAWFSLVLLSALFLLSLPAELYLNDKPLVMRVDGRWYWPLFTSYSLRDFGGSSPVPLVNYRSPLLQRLLEGGDIQSLDPAWIYGEDDRDLALEKDLSDAQVEADWQTRLEAERSRMTRAPSGKSREVFWLWPLVEYNYASKTYNPASGKEHLVAPWAVGVGDPNRDHRGAWRDGHWLGTDQQGKDVLARIVYGFRISLLFGLGLALSGTLIGCLLGALQGFFGGYVDLFGQRFTEVWSSMPRLYLLIILSSFLANTGRDMTSREHYWLLFGILNLTAWMGMAAYMRAEFLKARSLEYVKAARALGVSNTKIMFSHILPNALTPIITFTPFNITAGILALVSLDFLALGVRYPAPSLGELLAQGQQNLQAVWILLPTFMVLVVTLTLLTFVGDGVRDAFDPRVKKIKRKKR